MEKNSIDLKGRSISYRSDFSDDVLKVQTNVTKLSISPYIYPKIFCKKKKPLSCDLGEPYFPEMLLFSNKKQRDDNFITPRCKFSAALKPSIHRKLKSSCISSDYN